MEVSGVRSSWLTIARNSARSRSSSSRSVMSWRVTTTDLQLAILGADGRGVEQRGDAPSIGHPDDDLLGPHRLARAQRLHQGELLQRDLPPVGPPEGQRPQQLLRLLVGVPQAVDDPPGLPVERRRGSRSWTCNPALSLSLLDWTVGCLRRTLLLALRPGRAIIRYSDCVGSLGLPCGG